MHWPDGKKDKIICGRFFPKENITDDKFILVLRESGGIYKRVTLFLVSDGFLAMKVLKKSIYVTVCYECDAGYYLKYREGNYKLVQRDCCPDIDEGGEYEDLDRKIPPAKIGDVSP